MDVEVISESFSMTTNVEKAIIEVYKRFGDRLVDWKVSSTHGCRYLWFVIRKDGGK